MFSNNNMKKIVLWLFVIMLSCFAISVSILVSRGVNGTIGEFKKQNINTDKSFKSSDINDLTGIDVNTESTGINVISSDSKDIRVHFYGDVTSNSHDQIPELQAEIKDNILFVKVEYPQKFSIGINFSSRLNLDIYVPKSYSRNFKLNTISGGVDINNFAIERIDAGTVSGHINLTDLKTANTFINTTSGNTKISGFTGNIQFGSVSGGIDVGYTTFNNNIKISTTSGNSNIKLPESSEFGLNFSSVSGGFSSNFPVNTDNSPGSHKVNATVGRGINQITVNSVSGGLEINN